MKISIITAAFNAADTIADTIRSVSSQTHPEVEHIIVDGGSKDSTRDILDENIAFLDRVVSEPDEGLYYAMNKGIALASGDVVGILNADDVYAHPKVLERVAETIKVHDVQCCYADLVYVDRNNMNDVVRYWTSNTFVPGSFRRGWLPAHPTLFILRDVYEHYGSFDVDYKIQSDFELSMRFLEINRISSYYVPEIWVRMRMGGTTNRSLTNIIKGNLESYRACKKHGLGVGPMFFVTKIAQRLPQFFNRPG